MSAELSLFPSTSQTIGALGARIRSGDLPCVQLTETCLERIHRLDRQIHAWVSIDSQGALARARQLDDDLRAGRWHGPLHGIPIGIKDIIDVAGWPTAAGSTTFAQGPATHDAPLVARLRNAGAVILGKTVTTQFASFDPPPTRNPWNAGHTPGGSSSGSAAAVATGMCLAAIGSQTGGSITRPAAYCGVAGCKPTYGRVSLDGIVPLASSMDHPGPIARSVGDLRLVFNAIVANGASAIEETGSESPPRLGRLRGFFDQRAEPEALQALERALASLSTAGASISDATLTPSFDDVLRSHRVIMATEAAACHERRFAANPEDYQPRIRSLIEEGLAIPAPEYARCRQHQSQLQHEMPRAFDGIDALVCLAAPGPAPDTSTTGDPAFNSPWSYTGLPTVSFPIGLAANGLPLGIQLIGRANGEEELFRTAAWCEDVIRLASGWH